MYIVRLRWLLCILLGTALGFFIGLAIGQSMDNYAMRLDLTSSPVDDIHLYLGGINGAFLGVLAGGSLGAIWAYVWGRMIKKRSLSVNLT